MSVAWVGAGIAAYSAYSNSQTADKAANEQVASGEKANETELKMYNQTRDDNAERRQIGDEAIRRLRYRMGYGGAPGGLGGSGGTATPAESRDQIYNRLASQYTSQAPREFLVPGGARATVLDGGNIKIAGDFFIPTGAGGGEHSSVTNPAGLTLTPEQYKQAAAQWGQLDWVDPYQQGSSNQSALNQAVDREYANALSRSQGSPSGASNDADYGSLDRKFSMADFQADPGYEFRKSEGEKAISRAVNAKGGLYSGAMLKALDRFNQDTASNEYGNAYNRYNNDQTTSFNRNATIAGIGQTANSLLAGVGQNTANQIADNQTGMGNARASGYIGASNALGSGLAQGVNSYQANSLLNSFRQPQSSLISYVPSYANTGNPGGWQSAGNFDF